MRKEIREAIIEIEKMHSDGQISKETFETLIECLAVAEIKSNLEGILNQFYAKVEKLFSANNNVEFPVKKRWQGGKPGI